MTAAPTGADADAGIRESKIRLGALNRTRQGIPLVCIWQQWARKFRYMDSAEEELIARETLKKIGKRTFVLLPYYCITT